MGFDEVCLFNVYDRWDSYLSNKIVLIFGLAWFRDEYDGVYSICRCRKSG